MLSTAMEDTQLHRRRRADHGWGGSFIVPLNNRFHELGGTTLLNTALSELIREDGRVVGAKQ